MARFLTMISKLQSGTVGGGALTRILGRLRPLFRSVLSILWVIAVPTPSVLSKTPGVVHCYHLSCHRVLTIEETKSLVSTTRILVASYYDDPRVDPSNTG